MALDFSSLVKVDPELKVPATSNLVEPGVDPWVPAQRHQQLRIPFCSSSSSITLVTNLPYSIPAFEIPRVISVLHPGLLYC